MRHIVLFILLLSMLCGMGQIVEKPPYPIIFVHGWVGSDTTWKKPYGSYPDWQSFFNGLGWQNGGTINICLESNTESLHDEAYSDISFRQSFLSSGDFYFINFSVNRTDTLYPKLLFRFEAINASYNDTILKMTSNESNSPYHINEGDILVFDKALAITEYIKVKVANYNDSTFIVERGVFNSTPLEESNTVELKNHSNLSNQASIFKSGIGVSMAVDTVCKITGADRVILVSHSMGGLSTRQYIQSNSFRNDVAKLVTVSTPHLGSNFGNWAPLLINGFDGMDNRSDAVRDMRYTTFYNSDPPEFPYGDPPDNAVFLFGGQENTLYSGFAWYSADFNGDGIEDSTIINGLNINVEWPDSVLFHGVVNQRKEFYSRQLYGDDIVRKDRQLPVPDIVPSSLFDSSVNVFLTHFPLCGMYSHIYCPWPVFNLHTSAHRFIDNVMVGLDEPDVMNLAYEINVNQPDTFYNGFITKQSIDNPYDSDYYKFISFTDGIATLEFDKIHNDNFWHVCVYEGGQGIPVDSVVNPSFISSDGGTITFEVKQDSTYFIKFHSLDIDESYLNPYSFQVSISSFPDSVAVSSSVTSMAVFDVAQVLISVLDSNSNPIPNINTSLTTNNTGLFFSSFGICNLFANVVTNSQGAAYINYMPTVPGPHTITAVANINGITGTLPTPIIVSDTSFSKIVRYEYWFDNNTANIYLGSILPSATLNLSDSIILDDLATGFHTIHMRFRDFDGLYSQTVSQQFYKSEDHNPNSKIYSYEYWFDNDTNSRVMHYVNPVSEYVLIEDFGLTDHASGLHTIHLRFFDINGNASPLVSAFIYKRPMHPQSSITKYEYWFDNDHPGGVQQMIDPQSELILLDDYIISSLDNGLHYLNIRFADTNNLWSETISWPFTKYETPPMGGNLITAYRYWYDEQVNNAEEEIITPAAAEESFSDYIIESGLSHGWHTFSIQFKDTLGHWSSAISTPVIYDTLVHIWDGEVDSLWSKPLNWISDQVPDSIHYTVIPQTVNQPIILSDQKIRELNIYPGASVNVSNGHTLIISDSLILFHSPKDTSKLIIEGSILIKNN